MASTFPDDATQWHFHDLHAFKDFLSMVIVCAPDQFPKRDWLKPEQQMNLSRAFSGLRYGLALAAKEKGESKLLEQCRALLDEALTQYESHRNLAGQRKLEEMEQLLLTL